MSLINHMRRHSDGVFMLLSKQDLQRSMLFLFLVMYSGTMATVRHYGEVLSINLLRDELTMFLPASHCYCRPTREYVTIVHLYASYAGYLIPQCI